MGNTPASYSENGDAVGAEGEYPLEVFCQLGSLHTRGECSGGRQWWPTGYVLVFSVDDGSLWAVWNKWVMSDDGE